MPSIYASTITIYFLFFFITWKKRFQLFYHFWELLLITLNVYSATAVVVIWTRPLMSRISGSDKHLKPDHVLLAYRVATNIWFNCGQGFAPCMVWFLLNSTCPYRGTYRVTPTRTQCVYYYNLLSIFSTYGKSDFDCFTIFGSKTSNVYSATAVVI